MPVSVSFDEQRELVTLRYSGEPTFEEYSEAMREMFADPRFREGWGVLADRRGVPAPSADYIRRVTLLMKDFDSILIHTRWAMIVDGTASFGMARMGQALNDGTAVTLGVFNDEEQAVLWLAMKRRDAVD